MTIFVIIIEGQAIGSGYSNDNNSDLNHMFRLHRVFYVNIHTIFCRARSTLIGSQEHKMNELLLNSNPTQMILSRIYDPNQPSKKHHQYLSSENDCPYLLRQHSLKISILPIQIEGIASSMILPPSNHDVLPPWPSFLEVLLSIKDYIFLCFRGKSPTLQSMAPYLS